MISIKDISITRSGKLVVDGFSAELKSGTITAVIGPNGCGKSSLLAAIAGDIPIANGEIYYGKKRLSEMSISQLAQIRSVVMQSRNYWLSFTVRDILAMGQDGASIARIDQVLLSLNMVGFSEQSVTTLSGGEAQRLEIARALVRESDVYLLDEPMSAQDSASRAAIIELLKNLRSQGKTLLIITHSDEKSLDWCDQIFDLGS